MNKYLAVIGIIIVAFLLRVWNISEMPVGVTNDEADYIYNAYSVWKTGRDITGKYLPLSINLDNSFSPVPVYLYAPFVGILGLTTFAGRLPNAIMGALDVFLLFGILLLLFKNIRLSLIGAFVLAVSPWHIHISRTAYEGPLALFFVLLGSYCLLYCASARKNLLWSLPFFALAFYSYHATKVFIVLYIPLIVWFALSEFRFKIPLKNRLWTFSVYMALFSCILASFFIILKAQQVNRQHVFLWNNQTNIAKTVDMERTINSSPDWIKPIFNNKIFVTLRIIRENYLEIFSPQFLFLYGETSGLATIYGTLGRGVMYILELPFLLVGLYYLLQSKQKQLKLFIIICILISPLPTALAFDRSYVMRAVMIIPFLTILVAYGINKSYEIIKSLNTPLKYLWVAIIIVLYSFLIASYLYQYHFRYNLYGAEAWFKSSRDVIQYIQKNEKNYDQVLIANSGDLLIQYGFYTKMVPNVMHKLYASALPKKVGKVQFIGDCIPINEKLGISGLGFPKSILYVVPEKCYPLLVPTAKIVDSAEPLRTIWKIYSY
jgi:4-amino-4-deoxy-L-arabinose transferase-like glycosyltransferase